MKPNYDIKSIPTFTPSLSADPANRSKPSFDNSRSNSGILPLPPFAHFLIARNSLLRNSTAALTGAPIGSDIASTSNNFTLHGFFQKGFRRANTDRNLYQAVDCSYCLNPVCVIYDDNLAFLS